MDPHRHRPGGAAHRETGSPVGWGCVWCAARGQQLSMARDLGTVGVQAASSNGHGRVHLFWNGEEVNSGMLPVPVSSFRRYTFLCHSTFGQNSNPNFGGLLRDVFWYPRYLALSEMLAVRAAKCAPRDYMIARFRSWLQGPEGCDAYPEYVDKMRFQVRIDRPNGSGGLGR